MPNISFITICSLVAILLPSLLRVSGQNCRCAPGLCCSKFGFCGNTIEFCGNGCQAGPCIPQTGNSNKVSDIVTDQFFNEIINQAPASCPGKRFYTRAAFLQALGSFPEFGTTGTTQDSRQEIAAFFAHVTQETGHMCNIEESDKSNRYCNQDGNYSRYPCTPGKSYFGRGPLQLTWNYNYGPAGEFKGSFDGLRNPEIVATDQVVSFKAALWFWRTFCHDNMVSGKGFGETIRAINGDRECNGRNSGAVNNRVNYYTDYCNKLGVDPGSNNLRC